MSDHTPAGWWADLVAYSERRGVCPSCLRPLAPIETTVTVAEHERIVAELNRRLAAANNRNQQKDTRT